MTQPLPSSPATTDAGPQIAQLRHVLALVAQIADRPVGDRKAEIDESRIEAAYESAMPIVQRRFDALAAETATWAAAGVAAILAAGRGSEPPKAAAAALADELERALDRIAALLGL